MNTRYLASALLLGLALLFGARPLAAQTVTGAVCPSDSSGGLVHDGNGVYRTGVSARRFVVSFLRTDPTSISRTETGTSGIDSTSIRQLTDLTDAYACRRLNAFMNNGESEIQTSPPWVYFRAGNFYFIARWTPAQSRDNYTLRHEPVIVLDAGFNLLGVWTA